MLKVNDLMSSSVLHIKPNTTIAQAKKVFKENNINILPVIKDGELKGVVSQSDILTVENPFAQVHCFMNTKVYTIPQYSNLQLAAQLMKKHHIHHLIVTHEKSVVGVLSSYDLLDVIACHRYKEISGNSQPNKRVA